jgi:hypothetical protein
MSDILFHPLGNPIAGGDNLEKLADIDPRLTRTHYFDGRLLTAEDLERDQIYLDQRLREAGKALGSGIISGLELELQQSPYRLAVSPGKAMTSAGRVLHLTSRITVNPGDKGLIASLNDGQYRRFNRGLYIVVLRYREVATDIAEIFPTDLHDRRGADYALITESLQLGLVPLPLPLPAQDPLHIRSRLMAGMLDNELAASVIPEDAVSLGVLAIAGDTPQWIDGELMRHPLRREVGHKALQEDLKRQYQALLTDITAHRRAGGLGLRFAATDYFSLIPPAGKAPQDAFDPEHGFQGYFPESFQVSVAPIRQSDLELVQGESMGLPNIDLSRDRDISIMVLAPLSEKEYGHYARQLVADVAGNAPAFASPDPLRLRLYPGRQVHTLDTDASVWREIWSRIDAEQLVYVRRPVRAAETAVSGIVLANGTTLPQPAGPPQEESETGNAPVIESEDRVFLRMVNIPYLGRLRPPVNDDGEQALRELREASDEEPRVVQQALPVLLRVDRHYDPVIWQTLNNVRQRDGLGRLLEVLMKAEPGAVATGKKVLETGSDLGLPDALLERWKERLEALVQ